MAVSREFWARYQVEDFDTITEDESVALLEERDRLYPGAVTLMPLNHQGVILDFGCGPGSDTIGFLLNGAEHVYAADISPKALRMTCSRLAAHGMEQWCTPILIENEKWLPPEVDHIHAAGVLHPCAAPTATLRRLATGLRDGAEIRLMVYSSESAFYQLVCDGNPATFRLRADEDAPIANAWTIAEVQQIASNAGLCASHVGSYRHPTERGFGEGLSACYSVRRP